MLLLRLLSLLLLLLSLLLLEFTPACSGQAGRGPSAAWQGVPGSQLGSHWAWPPGPEQLSPPSSACRLQRWPQEEVVVAGGRDMDAAPPCRVSVPYLPESHSSQPGAPIPTQASETPGRAGLAYLLPVAGGGMSLFRGSAPGHPP